MENTTASPTLWFFVSFTDRPYFKEIKSEIGVYAQKEFLGDLTGSAIISGQSLKEIDKKTPEFNPNPEYTSIKFDITQDINLIPEDERNIFIDPRRTFGLKRKVLTVQAHRNYLAWMEETRAKKEARSVQKFASRPKTVRASQ